jgi:hypothetical protein
MKEILLQQGDRGDRGGVVFSSHFSFYFSLFICHGPVRKPAGPGWAILKVLEVSMSPFTPRKTFPFLAAFLGALALLPVAAASPYGGEAAPLSLLRRGGEAVLLASGPVDPSAFGPSEREALERELSSLAASPSAPRETLLCRFQERLSAGEIAALAEEGLQAVGAIPSRAYLFRGRPEDLRRLLDRPGLCWAARWKAP